MSFFPPNPGWFIPPPKTRNPRFWIGRIVGLKVAPLDLGIESAGRPSLEDPEIEQGGPLQQKVWSEHSGLILATSWAPGMAREANFCRLLAK